MLTETNGTSLQSNMSNGFERFLKKLLRKLCICPKLFCVDKKMSKLEPIQFKNGFKRKSNKPQFVSAHSQTDFVVMRSEKSRFVATFAL